MMPSSNPTAGAQAIAAATVAGANGDGTGVAGVPVARGDPVSPSVSAEVSPRSGITVSSVTDSRRPFHLMPEEPIGRPEKDVLS